VAGIRRVKGVKNSRPLFGKPRAAIASKANEIGLLLAVLLACGLRRHEAVSLEMRDVQQREEHWAIVESSRQGWPHSDGPVPDWVKALLDRWTQAAAITTGRILRRATKAGTAWGPA
jgi:integrase